MSGFAYAVLVIRGLAELIRYDLIHALLGFGHIYRHVERQPTVGRAGDVGTARVCAAVSMAVCLYWKRVYCLQRSAVTARLLRQHGVDARLVIGYRPSPFFSHAWVEVDGRVANDSPVYKERMHILCTL